MAKIHSKAFLEWLERFGVIPGNCRRVVIDAPADGPVLVHVEMYGSSEAIEVEPPPELRTGVRVVGKDAEAEFEQIKQLMDNLAAAPGPDVSPKRLKLEYLDLGEATYQPTADEKASRDQLDYFRHKWERPGD